MKLRWVLLTLPLVLSCSGAGRQIAAEETTYGVLAVDALIEDLRAAAEGEQRDVVLLRLRSTGVLGLGPTKAARDATAPGAIRNALNDAYLWQLAAKSVGVLQEGIDSQLTFDGQFTSLRQHGKEIVDALVRLVDDENAPLIVRSYATRALADVVEDDAEKRRILPYLRELNADILMAPMLREQIEILLAILGERNRLFQDIRRLEKMAESENVGLLLRTNEALATLNYRIRNYERAVGHYDRIVTIMEDVYEQQKKLGIPEESLAELQMQMALHYYNAACSNSLHQDIPKARELLKKAVRLRTEHFANIEKDGDLRALRADESYEEFRTELETMFEGRSL